MAYRKKSKAEVEEEERRVQDLETVLVQLGERSARQLQRKWGLDSKTFDRLLEKAQASILVQAQSSSRWRRAAMLRKVQLAIQQAQADKKYGAVAALVAREEQLSSGLGNVDYCEEAAAKLGEPPKDPDKALLYARRALLLNLPNILRDPALDTKTRTFLLNDTCAKLGITHDRARIEEEVTGLEGKIKGTGKKTELKKPRPGTWKKKQCGPGPTEQDPPAGGEGEPPVR